MCDPFGPTENAKIHETQRNARPDASVLTKGQARLSISGILITAWLIDADIPA
jgi:hypothetical protein